MTCTCSINSAFRWRDWPRDKCGWLATEDLSRRLSAATSAVINDQRAAGIDPAHIAGMRSQAAYDPRIYVVKA